MAELLPEKPAQCHPAILQRAGEWVHIGYVTDGSEAIGCACDFLGMSDPLHATHLTELGTDHPLAGEWAVTDDPAAMVTGLDGKADVWFINQNLTDRWGDMNNNNTEGLPTNKKLLKNLRSQMWDEITFIVRKDGKFGVLFEVEFCSRESECHLTKDQQSEDSLHDHAVVVAALLKGLKEVEVMFPGVALCVPSPENIVHDRPAVWAFVKDGQLTEDQREALGMKLLSL